MSQTKIAESFSNLTDQANLLDELPLAALLLKSDGQITYCNDLAIALFDALIINKSWLDVIKEHISLISSGGQYITLKNNKTIAVRTQAIKSLNAQLLILIDITDIKKENDQIHKLNNLKSISQMSSTLAHQLKTPLTTAMIHLSTLEKRALEKGEKNEYIVQRVSKIKDQLSQIKNLIESELSLFKTSDLQVESVNLIVLLKELVEEYSQVHTSLSFKFQEQADANPYFIYCNKVSLKSGFQNIIDNAVEASDANGFIDINFYVNENMVFINIIDYGSGIKESEVDKISTPYFTTKKSGTGLGVPIAKAIFEAHGGGLQFSSTKKYTVFTIYLPKAKEAK